MPGKPLTDRADKLLAALDFAGEIEARERAHREETAALLTDLLELADVFDRLLGAVGPRERSPRSVPLQTVRALARRLERCLEVRGVTPIPCLGEVADPRRHEIVEVRDAEGVERDRIVEVVDRGYQWNGRPLRAPRVVVAGQPQEEGR